MTGAGTHDICISNLSWISAITSACPAVPGMAAPRVPSFNLPALRSLSAVPVRPETLSRFGMMAMLGSLTASLGRSIQLPRIGAQASDPLSSLRTQLAGMRTALMAPPPSSVGMPNGMVQPCVQWPGGWQGASLLAAANILAPLGIDIFAPGGGAALAAHVGQLGSWAAGQLGSWAAGQLGSQNILARMAEPGISANLAADLQRLGSLGAGAPLLQGMLPAQGHGPAWPGGMEGLATFLHTGPVGLLCSPKGRELLPDSAEITAMTNRLRQLESQKPLNSLPASLRLPGGGITDPFAAFERSGCCAVLNKITNLQAAGNGARRMEAMTASLSSIRKGFGIDPIAKDAQQNLGQAVREVEQTASRLPGKLTSLLENPDLPRAATFLSTLAQAGNHSLHGL